MIQAGSLFYGVTFLNNIQNVHRNAESATQEHLVAQSAAEQDTHTRHDYICTPHLYCSIVLDMANLIQIAIWLQ